MSATKALELYKDGDYAGALRHWLPLAMEGDIDSQAWIGTLYENGHGVDVSDREAFEWYQRSAEGGNCLAQNNVGVMYAHGRGVPQDYGRSAQWFGRAVEQGDMNSMFNLAVFYAKGTGVPKDMDRALHLYSRAAELGHPPSQARLGYLCCGNDGVQKDRVKAFVWLTLAGNHGAGHALTALEPIVEQMSLEEKQEGQEQLARFQSKRILEEI